MRTGHYRVLFATAILGASPPLYAGFGSTETYPAAVGRVPGQGGAHFYSTVWASNLTIAPRHRTRTASE